jgi:KDO2-lipid IV(A) lauroyltransferase
MRHKVILLLVKAASRLPLWLAQWFGVLLGRLSCMIPNRECENARINLEICFPELSDKERERLLCRSMVENAKTLMEAPGTWLGDPGRWVSRIDPQGGSEVLKSLLARGRGVIIAAPHIGNWEAGVHFLAGVAPITVLYRPPRQEGMEEIVKKGRAGSGARLVPTNASGVKALFGALRAGEMVAILPDQQPKSKEGGAGVFAPFFGHPALTMVLVNRLAKKTGAAVIYVITERLPAAKGYRMHWVQAPEGMDDADPERAAAALNQGIEACVRRLPEQYQWSYKRFKATPDDGPSIYKTKR